MISKQNQKYMDKNGYREQKSDINKFKLNN